MSVPDLSFIGASDWHFTGSRFICDPAPTDTDLDLIVHVSDLYSCVVRATGAGFELDGSIPENAVHSYAAKENHFVSLKRGELNLICTQSASFYQKFVTATLEARRLNLLLKSERIALFQKILYGNAS